MRGDRESEREEEGGKKKERQLSLVSNCRLCLAEGLQHCASVKVGERLLPSVSVVLCVRFGEGGIHLACWGDPDFNLSLWVACLWSAFP